MGGRLRGLPVHRKGRGLSNFARRFVKALGVTELTEKMKNEEDDELDAPCRSR